MRVGGGQWWQMRVNRSTGSWHDLSRDPCDDRRWPISHARPAPSPSLPGAHRPGRLDRDVTACDVTHDRVTWRWRHGADDSIMTTIMTMTLIKSIEWDTCSGFTQAHGTMQLCAQQHFNEGVHMTSRSHSARNTGSRAIVTLIVSRRVCCSVSLSVHSFLSKCFFSNSSMSESADVLTQCSTALHCLSDSHG